MNEQFTLIFDNFSKMTPLITGEVVHVFFDQSVSQQVQQKITNYLSSNNKRVLVSLLSQSGVTENFIISLKHKSENFVIGVGGVYLQSVVKYYSYMNYLPYAIIPQKEVSEFSFSKHAYIKDKYYCFYECEKPKFCFICSELFDKQDVYNLVKVLSYKNISNYECEFNRVILNKTSYNFSAATNSINICDANLAKVIKLYAGLSIELDKTKTYNFLSSEYNLLKIYAGSNSSFVLDLLDCQNLLAKFYDCMLKFDFFKTNIDVNMHLKKLKQFLNINVSNLTTTIMPSFTEEQLNDVLIKLKAYKPHLSFYFNVCKNNFICSKINLHNKNLQKALALAADLSASKNIYRLARDLGYLETIVKDL